ncbi:TPA: transcriptional regulator [Kluyvera ascorbata]|uniref:Transcriptional regulator n=1 Tax=Kluyvera genomosp. 2 TaxID=2774054 RepID=A0A2T2XWJ5_9ENTR|nr:helix-turn-helix transcriptional regulator [Kluyvera genomosp. 2]HAT3920667.1 transcriptional regulator [Kluyvera ascorbata]PSR44680.1 transcriptional regulator [Kluyvera genomosp. 2]HAT3946180.1 transcriptional regulator [Kluyvera ascorbata]HAT3950657.1 transcriptional regulator [Kluyvera ascorbata]HDG1667825.1 transcriptional regulator [Kluyvera ascorbata]
MKTLTPQEIIVALNGLGLTQTDIKDRTGISQASLSRIYSGKNCDPRLSVVRLLEDLYLEVTEKCKA